MYEKLIRVAEFNAECANILEKLHDPVFTLIQRNDRTPWFNEKTKEYHFIDVNRKEKTTGYWDIFFKLSMVFDKLENKNKYTSALELMVCLLGFFYNTTSFYEVSEEIKSLSRLRKTYYGESQEDVDKLKDTMKVASELFLDLHRAMTVFDTLSDEIELD